MNAIDQLTEHHGVESVATEENSRTIGGVIVGRLVGLRESGEPFVDFPGNISAVALNARSVLPLVEAQIGREILLTFEEGDPERPIVIGLMESFSAQRQPPLRVKLDEDSVVFTAEREIVLRCGKASITLTRAGKVLIRGAYLLSRSSGANRIKGGSVQIN